MSSTPFTSRSLVVFGRLPGEFLMNSRLDIPHSSIMSSDPFSVVFPYSSFLEWGWSVSLFWCIMYSLVCLKKFYFPLVYSIDLFSFSIFVSNLLPTALTTLLCLNHRFPVSQSQDVRLRDLWTTCCYIYMIVMTWHVYFYQFHRLNWNTQILVLIFILNLYLLLFLLIFPFLPDLIGFWRDVHGFASNVRSWLS